ncbi:MAG: hypothetical protein IT536_20590 [Hyphomicrobiales bacterium]|nr:hypothetical protein [Hyphomicrobiales bacterium]
MTRKNNDRNDPASSRSDGIGIDRLLDPANAFAHPMDVVEDRDLTLTEKRAILASWASDACAVEAAPALRNPTGSRLVRFDDVMDALKELDRRHGGIKPPPRYRRILQHRIPGVFGRDDSSTPGQSGAALN